MTKKPISPEVLEALRQIDSATVSNAIEHFKVRDPVVGYASMELRCQFPDLKPMLGYAVTARADTTSPGRSGPMRLGRLLDLVEAAPKPVVVVVQYTGPDRLRSCVAGDMLSTALQKLGVVGIVTDMGNRDIRSVQRRAPGFHIFCPGLVVSHGYGVFLDFNAPVSICGLNIEPGDLLHGDENGLVNVPLEIAESVVGQAKAVHKTETEFFDFVQSSEFTFEGLKSRIGHH